jgi:hypothetical protein
MKHNPYSYSRIRTYIECQRKFKLRYIDKVPEGRKPPSVPMMEGSLFHKFTEIYDRARMEHRKVPWLSAFSQALSATEEILSVESVNSVKSLCQNYASHPEPIEHLIGVEYKWAMDEEWDQCEYDDPEAMLRGVWDKLYIDGGLAHIKDHKTSRLANSDPLQRDFYVAAVADIFPQVSDVRFSFLYHRFNWKDEMIVSRKGIEEAKQMVSHLIHKIEADLEFPPNENCQDSLCPYRRYCVKNIAALPSGDSFATEPTTLEEAMEMALNVLSAEKSIRQAKRLLKKFVEENGEFSIGGKTFCISSSQTWKGIEVLDLLAVLKNLDVDDWWKCVSPNWKAVREAINQKPEIEKKLDEIGERKLNQSFSSKKTSGDRNSGDNEDFS